MLEVETEQVLAGVTDEEQEVYAEGDGVGLEA